MPRTQFSFEGENGSSQTTISQDSIHPFGESIDTHSSSSMFSLFGFLINGSSSSIFSASQGIYQGDPLSPFYFSLVVKGLRHFLKYDMLKDVLWAIHLIKWLAPITHQQPMHETMLIGETSIRESFTFKSILNKFMLALRTKINPNKSQVFFFNTNPSI